MKQVGHIAFAVLVAGLLFVGTPVFALNPLNLSVSKDPIWTDGSYGPSDTVRDWQQYCAPGTNNIVRWYTSDNILRSQSQPLDCAIGMPDNTSYPAGIPGAISVWNYGSSIIPASLPHGIGNFGGDGDYYLTVTSNASRYTSTTTNPSGLAILLDNVYNDGLPDAVDLVEGWNQYCTPGTTNTVRWYANNILHSTLANFDCTVGMPSNVSYPAGIPGAITLWQFSSSIIPATLPHGSGNTGPDGDYYITLTNGNNSTTRYDWGWHSTTTLTRFDWGWHNGAYTFPATNTTPTYCTPGVDSNCNSNVMFLPGIEGSRLYVPGALGENQIWEPDSLTPFDLSNLDMMNTGATNSVYAKDKDIIDIAYKNLPGADSRRIYSSFIEMMNTLIGNGNINAWEPIAYDWRLDYSDLLAAGNNDNGKIYYRGSRSSTSTPYVIQELKRLADNSKTRKVTIIAHSNGGLLAKALLTHPEYAQFVDKLILVASPQLGTPQAIGGLMHGFNQGFKFPGTVFFTDADARQSGLYLPMSYNLLPSSTYFNATTKPVITFDPVTLQDWVTKYGQNITTQNQLRIFMTDMSRTKPTKTDLVTPEIVSEQLFENAISVHATFDDQPLPSNIKLITIAGWGNETLSGIAYKKVPQFTCLIRAADGSCASNGNVDVLTYAPKFDFAGDGTVIESSAQWESGTSSTKYWLDLMTVNATTTSRVGHGTLFEVPELRSLLTALITNTSSPLPQHIFLYKPSYTGTEPRLHFTLHSPLTLSFYDTQGNFTGSTVSTSSPQVATTYFNVPGVQYERFGEVQWLSIPKSMAGRVVMQGTGSGSFALDIEEVNGNDVLAATTFAAVPSATSTYAYVDISPNQSPTASSTLVVDFDSNGTPDSVLKSEQGAVVLPDITPPVTAATATGTLGKNGWYTGNVQITFNATDTESGVANTFFSLDGAATSTGTTTTITIEGIHILRYFSTDTAGNAEMLKTLTVKIDKTPPEAKLIFNTVTQVLDITGADNLSSTTVQTTATSSIIADQAGHTLQIFFMQLKPKDRRITISITALKYDGLSTTTTAILKYKWKTDKNNLYTMLASYLKTATSTIESHYRPKKKQTIIMLSPQDLDDSDNDDNADARQTKVILPGLVIPFFTTSKGALVGAW